MMSGVENAVVLMLHGFLGSPQNWRECAEAMSVRHRVLVPELPIFSGRQLADRKEHTLRFLLQLMEAERVRRVVVMGNSLGGQLALHIGRRISDRVVGLVLTGCGGLDKPKSMRTLYRRRGREWLRGYIQEMFHGETMVTEAMVDELESIFNDRERLREVVRMAKNIREFSVQELLPQMHCPVLIVWGAEDRITPLSTAREFQKRLPNSELHIIPQCGHVPMMEQPAEFTRLAEEFMQRLPGRQMAHDLMSRT